MKYSISNIAWAKEEDEEMYSFMEKNQIQAIEVAPFTPVWRKAI